MFNHFVFDGMSSIMEGIRVVHFQNEDLTQSGGSSSELGTFFNKRTSKWKITSLNYTEPLKFTIQITNHDFKPIDTVRERYLNRWLLGSNTKYRWFQIVDNDDYQDIMFRVKITNPERLVIGGKVYGLQYTITCDAPWGYSNLKHYIYTYDNKNNELRLCNDGDEFSCVYPHLTITVNEDCDLRIDNDQNNDNEYFLIKNLKENETVVIDNEKQIISTNRKDHEYILGDFNKCWLRLYVGNNYLKISNNCTIDFQYRTVRKVGAL